MPDYQDHISQARELLEMAAQTPEGRAEVRRWTQQVADALPGDEPDAVLDPAAEWQAAQLRAAQQMGYGNLALSETGDAGIELYPDTGLGHYDDAGLYPGPGSPDNNGGQPVPQYSEAQLRQARQADDIMRYEMMLRGGPQRPQYAGLTLSGDSPAEEADADDLVAATMQLSARTEGRASYAECAAAVDELSAGEPSRRAQALVDLARRYPGGSPAADDLELDLARRREVDRLTGQPGTDPRVEQIIARNPGVLSREPRRGQTHVAVIQDEDSTQDRRQPDRGGVLHAEVERIAREHGLYFGGVNERYPVKSAAQREREQRRAAPTRPGAFSIEELHRSAQRSASSSRG